MAIATTPRRLAPARPQLPVVVVAALSALVMLLLARGAAQPQGLVARPAVDEARPLATARATRSIGAASSGVGRAQMLNVVEPTTASAAAPAPIPAFADAPPAVEPAPTPIDHGPRVRTGGLELWVGTPSVVLGPTGGLPESSVVAPAASPPPTPPPALAANAATTAVAPLPVVPAPAAAPATAAPVASAPPSAREQLLLDAMNAQRVAAGVPALLLNSTLTQAARVRSQDMATGGYFAHVGPAGQSWYTALATVGWSMSGGGENLAKVAGDESTSVAVAMDRLLASPTHRANIVSRAFRLVGIGAVVDASGATIFTTIFTDR